jgi:hypothetical protein
MANDVASTLLLTSCAALVNRAGLTRKKIDSTHSAGSKCQKVNPRSRGDRGFPGGPQETQEGLTRKELVMQIVELEIHTFDIGSTKYAAKYQKSVDAIANHIQK